MAVSIIICDDSRMARNQLARCLPPDWEVDIHFAEDGRHCLEVASQVEPKLVFLDLNMPEMDGYETLEEFNAQNLGYDVIVVSGDIQPDAQARVVGLGAIDFVKKPISKEKMLATLESHGLYSETAAGTKTEAVRETAETDLNDKATFIDACQEIANIAMGRAGDSLARFLDVFVELPVPKVNHIELSELVMALQFAEQDTTVSSVCQGFIGPGLSGEALIIFNDSSFKNIAELMKYQGKIDDHVELELLMDISNILVGACLQGISDQLDISLSQGHPVVLGQHVMIPNLIKRNKQWRKTLSIEINYSIENRGVDCDLLLLFTEDCIETLKQRISYII
ncbi:response regulator [Aliikangiella coralliicola]|uniref:Response regulator n=1 Tax=Aliikangiella coralliicola TaxID=2592383 RepID=A0A545UBY2_9GAMM|nr:response regulator [Aliikangiella coralliicola]TQV86981.1 response regulator [Aliikangiella coralliicola]